MSPVKMSKMTCPYAAEKDVLVWSTPVTTILEGLSEMS
jgi:hypothetical protein